MITGNVDLNDPLIFKLWAKAVADEINPEDVKPVAFQNGWLNYDSSHTQAGYYKHQGRVYLQGFIKSGTIGTVPAFTLPEDYRPGKRVHLVAISNGAIGAVRVHTDGEVQLTQGSNVWFSLDGLSFRI